MFVQYAFLALSVSMVPAHADESFAQQVSRKVARVERSIGNLDYSVKLFNGTGRTEAQADPFTLPNSAALCYSLGIIKTQVNNLWNDSAELFENLRKEGGSPEATEEQRKTFRALRVATQGLHFNSSDLTSFCLVSFEEGMEPHRAGIIRKAKEFLDSIPGQLVQARVALAEMKKSL